MPEELRSALQLKSEISNNIEHDASNLPLEVDNYHSLSLLEASSNLPVPSSTTYKATHSSTGIKYCLRRLHGTLITFDWYFVDRLPSICCQQVSGFNQWNWWCKLWTCGKSSRIQTAWRSEKSSQQKLSAIAHSYLCMIFMPARKRFSRNTLHLSPTAMERRVQRFLATRGHSVTKVRFSGQVSDERKWWKIEITVWTFTANGPILQENEIWNVIIQLTCGLRAIHQANLACRWGNWCDLELILRQYWCY